MSVMRLLVAIGQKHWNASQAMPVPHTQTPIANLTQRSVVVFNTVPMILAGKGLFKPIPERHSINAIGRFSMSGHDFYRAYLSQTDGAFIQIAVAQHDPAQKIQECRLFQPYRDEVVLETKEDAAFWLEDRIASRARSTAGDIVISVAGQDVCMTEMINNQPYIHPLQGGDAFSFNGTIAQANEAALAWSEQQFCGVIGNPTFQGHPDDGSLEYRRSWVASDRRIPPFEIDESILDANGVTHDVRYSFMQYSRKLPNDILEYMLVAAVEDADGANVALWLGIDIEVADLTVYPSAG